MEHTKPDDKEIDELGDAEGVQERVSESADRVVTLARARAPKDTGAGAASIHKEELPAEGEDLAGYAVSWDREHDYMRFSEFGTERMAARPFLRPAVEEVGTLVVSPNLDQPAKYE